MTGSTSNSLTPEQTIEQEEKRKEAVELVRNAFKEASDSAPGYKFTEFRDLLIFLHDFETRNLITKREYSYFITMLEGVKNELKENFICNEAVIDKLVSDISKVLN